MDGIAVDGVDIAFFVVLEDDITPERTGANDVLETFSMFKVRTSHVLTYSVGHNVSILLIDDKAGGLTGQCRICIESAGLAEVD